MGTIVTNLARLPADVTLIFHHIPKTAGSTLNAVLDANYAPAAIHSIESPILDALRAFRALPEEAKRGLRVVRGHGVLGLHAELEQACIYAVLLRDPVERAVSQYFFIRGSPKHPLHAAVMEQGPTLEAYLECGVNPQADNGQVRALSGIGSGPGPDVPYGACTADMLATALQNLDAFYALVGVTARFDEFLLACRRALAWRTVRYVRRKVTRERPAPHALTASERGLIEACNRYDLELYRAAVARANRLRDRQSWTFPFEMALFQRRNSREA